MNQEVSAEQLQQGRAIIQSCLTSEDMEHLKHLLDEQATSTLTPEQKAAIRGLFESFGLL